ncbi:MAG: hypothetical protein JWQ98_1117 [Chlorobi bacterium]|nr:hypothetical protein [Chlorobiota bacterium]
MIPVFKSLETIATGYTVFEHDQVLTHTQLNSVADYADDQIRLTRIKLVGVGIACGLRVSLTGNVVALGRGVGVTTDGDLMYLDSDALYTQFKPYDNSYPAYPPLYAGGDVHNDMLPAYELVRQGVTDARAEVIGQFGLVTGKALDQMVAVLLMESYVKDDDLCSGTDCDNLGNEALNTVKLLLVEKSLVSALIENIPTVGKAYGMMAEIVADRPLIDTPLDVAGQLAALYRAACAGTHAALLNTLGAIWPAASAFFGDVFSADPSAGWIARLNALRNAFAGSETNIQYYYDFLKDLAETYNAFRESLFGDATWCSPNIASFPKHLLLGDLVPGVEAGANRTGFYPSPITSRTAGELDRAKFLLRKLDLLIRTFAVSAAADTEIIITPSSFEDDPLEERAIPFYYPANSTTQIHRYWNYRLTRRGMEARNYSYHAAAYGAQGGAANPFRSQIGRFSFFRIEGCNGKPVSIALETIEGLISKHNLPFSVRAVMIGADRTRVWKKPGIRYTDLHRLHYVLRQDAARQLDAVSGFSTVFKQKVDAEPTTATETPENCDSPTLRELAATSSADVVSRAAIARAKLDVPYSVYRADPSWQESLRDTISTAGQFKANLGSVARTEFSTPFDTLISSTHIAWLPWLDDLIVQKDQKEDEKLLLAKFLNKNPSLEHFAGVARGGTFILVYTDTPEKTVVADFMVPYICCDTVEEEQPEPPKPLPTVRPPLVFDQGIKIQPSRNMFINTKVAALRPEIQMKIDEKFKFQSDRMDEFVNRVEPQLNRTIDEKLNAQNMKMNDFVSRVEPQLNKTIDEKFAFQRQYVDLFKESVALVRDAGKQVAATDKGLTIDRMAVPVISDDYLNMRVNENILLTQKAELARQKAEEMGTTDQAKRFIDEATRAESDLATSTLETIRHIDEFKIDVTPGSEGARVIESIAPNLQKLSDKSTRKDLVVSLEKFNATTDNPDLRALNSGLMSGLR